MSYICNETLKGNKTMSAACKETNVDLPAFRHRILHSEIPHVHFNLSTEEVIEITRDIMSPEEKIFRDVIIQQGLSDDPYFSFEFADDFESTVKDLLQRTCDDRQYKVMLLRYYNDQTYQEIADVFNVSMERIRQLHKRSLAKLGRSDKIKRMILGDDAYAEYISNMSRCQSVEKIVVNLSAVSELSGVYDSCDRSLEAINEELQQNMSKSNINVLDLSARTFNCLKRAGIHTIQDALDARDSELLKLRNFGVKCLDELHTKLEEMGFQK
jgi:RNA polymerase sigma factor (sigma-70 family)